MHHINIYKYIIYEILYNIIRTMYNKQNITYTECMYTHVYMDHRPNWDTIEVLETEGHTWTKGLRGYLDPADSRELQPGL